MDAIWQPQKKRRVLISTEDILNDVITPTTHPVVSGKCLRVRCVCVCLLHACCCVVVVVVMCVVVVLLLCCVMCVVVVLLLCCVMLL